MFVDISLPEAEATAAVAILLSGDSFAEEGPDELVSPEDEDAIPTVTRTSGV